MIAVNDKRDTYIIIFFKYHRMTCQLWLLCVVVNGITAVQYDWSTAVSHQADVTKSYCTEYKDVACYNNKTICDDEGTSAVLQSGKNISCEVLSNGKMIYAVDVNHELRLMLK